MHVVIVCEPPKYVTGLCVILNPSLVLIPEMDLHIACMFCACDHPDISSICNCDSWPHVSYSFFVNAKHSLTKIDLSLTKEVKQAASPSFSLTSIYIDRTITYHFALVTLDPWWLCRHSHPVIMVIWNLKQPMFLSIRRCNYSVFSFRFMLLLSSASVASEWIWTLNLNRCLSSFSNSCC